MDDNLERRAHSRIDSLELSIKLLINDWKNDQNDREHYRKHLQSIVDKHESLLRGNGSGIVTRVKELETAKNNHTFHVRTIWVAVIGSLVGLFVK